MKRLFLLPMALLIVIFAIVPGAFCVEIQMLTVNLDHQLIDPSVLNVEEGGYETWVLHTEIHLVGDSFDPQDATVWVNGPTIGNVQLDYLPWFYDLFDLYVFHRSFPVDALTPLADYEGTYTFQVSDGTTENLILPIETLTRMDVADVTWDAATETLFWTPVEGAEFYNIHFFELNENGEIYTGNMIQITDATSSTVSFPGSFQIIGLQALDYSTELGFVVNQSMFCTAIFAEGVTPGDSDLDQDVDGADLYNYNAKFNGLSLRIIAASFGKLTGA